MRKHTVNFPGDKELYVDNWSDDEWNDTESVSGDKPEAQQSSDEGHPKEDSRVSSLVTWIVGFMLIFKVSHVISDSAMDALLKLICILMKMSGRFSDFSQGIAQEIPSSVYKLYRTFKKFHKICSVSKM